MHDRRIFEAIGIDSKTSEALIDAGVESLDALCNMTLRDAPSLRGIGMKRVNKIEACLAHAGLSFATKTVSEMVEEYLRGNRCTGLCHADCESGCHVSNLAPCGNIRSDCRAVPWIRTHKKAVSRLASSA